MAIRRRFASVPPVMVSSVKRSRSYEAIPVRSGRYSMAYPSSRAYSSRADDYMDHRVSDAGFLSNYALEEGYDTARKSRNRDAQLLRDATDAIVFSESFATPYTSVAARRVARGQSMVPRASSLPPRPLYPEVDFWDAPRSRVPLYTADTTTTEDYNPYLSYFRRPLVYPSPWLPRWPERAKSVPPVYYFPEEPRRKVQHVPVFDYWRRSARATSVPFEVQPATRPWYFPYFKPGLSSHYRRRLALSQLPRDVPVMPLPTEGLRAHRHPRHFLSRLEVGGYLPSLWPHYDEERSLKRRQREEEEEMRPRIRPRVLASPLARANFARAWRYALSPFAAPKTRLGYFLEPKHGFPLLYVSRKGQSKHPKAAIIASKMEVDTLKGRRPRSDYAARKYRAMHRGDQESIYSKPGRTAGFYASAPPLKRWW